MTTTVRPRNPADLAVLLPYQLGYHPGPSVVVIHLHGKRFGMVQRHDLLTDPADCAAVARHAMSVADREGATAVLVLAHEEEAGGSAPLSEAMVFAAGETDVAVNDRVVVRGDRWYAPDCGQSCCPAEGLPLPAPEDVPAVAAFVHAGVAPLPSREALVRGIVPEPDAARVAAVAMELAALGHTSAAGAFGGGPSTSPSSWADRAPDVVLWWTDVLDPRPDATPVADLPATALAWLSISLQDVVWRDALMGVLCPGSMPMTTADDRPEVRAVRFAAIWCPWVPGDDADAGRAEDWHDEILLVRARLVELARSVPEDVRPPVLTLLAHLAWWTGDGTVAGVALEESLRIDPDYRLAQLMMQLLAAGVRPWEEPGAPAGGAAA